jgi:hypothetical protein
MDLVHLDRKDSLCESVMKPEEPQKKNRGRSRSPIGEEDSLRSSTISIQTRNNENMDGYAANMMHDTEPSNKMSIQQKM